MSWVKGLREDLIESSSDMLKRFLKEDDRVWLGVALARLDTARVLKEWTELLDKEVDTSDWAYITSDEDGLTIIRDGDKTYTMDEVFEEEMEKEDIEKEEIEEEKKVEARCGIREYCERVWSEEEDDD